MTDYDGLLDQELTPERPTAALEAATILQQCKVLLCPLSRRNVFNWRSRRCASAGPISATWKRCCRPNSKNASRRLIERRLREAHLPRIKTLEEFDFARTPRSRPSRSTNSPRAVTSPGRAGHLYRRQRDRQDPSAHWVGGGGLSAETPGAFRHRRRADQRTGRSQASTATRPRLARWARYDLIAIDEVGYVPLAEVGAEFLFQVIAERAEKAAVIVTTNLPFSEWTQVIPNARLCKALVDRITDRAHIIETGTESYRFRRTLEKRKNRTPIVDASG